MDPARIIGLIVVVAGLIIAGDASSFGMKTPAAGIAIAAVGGFVLIYSLFAQSEAGNRGASGRRVRDHSI